MIKKVIETTYTSEGDWRGLFCVSEDEDIVSRKLYLATDSRDKLVMLFYESSGTSMPEEHRKGNIYPILGIAGEGEVGRDVQFFYHPYVEVGWFAKHLTRKTPRDSYIANFDKPHLYVMATELEALRDHFFMSDVWYQVVDQEKFFDICDSYYNDKKVNYYPRTYMQKHRYIDRFELLEKIDKKYGK